MEYEGPNRREFLQEAGAGALGLLSLLAGLPANAQKATPKTTESGLAMEALEPLTQPYLEQERRNLILDFRKKALGFDIEPMLNFAMGQIGIPSKKLPRILRRLAASRVDLHQGVSSIRQLAESIRQFAEYDPIEAYEFLAQLMNSVNQKELEKIKAEKIRFALEFASGMLSEKEKKDARALDLYKARVTEMIRNFITLTLGIDIKKMADHVAKYSRDDMAILYGPNTMFHEYAGSLLHEPFALYLQMVFGRRATEIWPVDPPDLPPVPKEFQEMPGVLQKKSHPMYPLAQAFFNPRYQHLAMISHGNWFNFNYLQYGVRPEESVARMIMLYNKDPKAFINFISELNPLCPKSMEILFVKLGVPFSNTGLNVTNSILERWINQFCAQAGISLSEFEQRFKKKGRIVRYTCGAGKYQLIGNSHGLSIPNSVRRMMAFDSFGFGAKTPDYTGKYEEGVAQAIREYNIKHRQKVSIRARDGFGLPLVQNPDQLFGYEGIAWLDNYIPNPIPKQGRIDL